MSTALGCLLLGVILPAPDTAPKYWLEVQVIEYAEQGLKPFSGTGGQLAPKDARTLRAAWQPLAGNSSAHERTAAGSLSLQVQFNRYGVESHFVEIAIEHGTGAGRAAFTHGASVRLHLEPGQTVAFGDISVGGRRRQAFTVTLRRWK